jgi:hypothetical protein
MTVRLKRKVKKAIKSSNYTFLKEEMVEDLTSWLQDHYTLNLKDKDIDEQVSSILSELNKYIGDQFNGE